MVVPIIDAIGEIARLANNILEIVRKNPLTSLERFDDRIKAEDACTDII